MKMPRWLIFDTSVCITAIRIGPNSPAADFELLRRYVRFELGGAAGLRLLVGQAGRLSALVPRAGESR